MHWLRTLPEVTKIFAGVKVKIDIRYMEQFVLKQEYLPCATL